MIDPAAAAARADEMVSIVFRLYPTEGLRTMVEIGKRHEAVAEGEAKIVVLALNTALQREIERRQDESLR